MSSRSFAGRGVPIQRSQPEPTAYRRRTCFLSSITVRELATGALLLRRRDERQGRLIQQWIEARVLTAFADRILAVDTAVARRCAALHVPDPRPYRDSLIAATALVHGLTVATRNRADFEPMAVPVLNPWD